MPVFSMSDEKFAACAGFDALAYVRTLRMFLRMAFWIMMIVCILVLPVNWTGHGIDAIIAEQRSKPTYVACQNKDTKVWHSQTRQQHSRLNNEQPDLASCIACNLFMPVVTCLRLVSQIMGAPIVRTPKFSIVCRGCQENAMFC
jgi:hypothetical protein